VELKEIIEDSISSNEDKTTEEFPKDPLEPVSEAIVEPEDNSEDDAKFAMSALSDLFKDYIGVTIVGFSSYKDSIKSISDDIGPRRGLINLLSDVELDGNVLWLKLTNYNGKHGGYIKIVPSMTASFSEKNSAEDPDKSVKYRLSFMGEDCIEYTDKDDKGEISYFPGHRQ
jgi:hypothetical protein